MSSPIETRIREAYASLAPHRGAWLLITHVRAQLTEIAGAELDAAFRRLSRAEDVDMMPESNQKALTAEDHRNAVRVGGMDNHLIAIGMTR